MKIKQLTKIAANKSKFKTISDFSDFAEKYLEYIATRLQAVIISQNENHYQFYQYGSDGGYQITRPINSRLMYAIDDFLAAKKAFGSFLKDAKNVKSADDRQALNRFVYTLQMSIGSALDALPAGKSNTARKINGDLFERLIRLIINDIGVECESGVVQIPVMLQGKEQFRMSYQHDLIVKTKGPFPKKVTIVLGNLVYIEKVGLPPAMLNRLLRLAAFQNPEFYKAQAMRLSTFGKPRIIACGEDFPKHIGLPRGCFEEVIQLLSEYKIQVEVQDERFQGISLPVNFHGELRPAQKEAALILLKEDIGILSATTAFGKTVIGAWLIAARKINTLILVHRRQLMDQWKERLSLFLGIDKKEIGQIGGGKTKCTGKIDVGILQSLNQKGEVDGVVSEYGQVIVDECHHLSAFSFEQVLKSVKARYVIGLTATPTRKDGHHPIIQMQCGPIRFKVNPKEEAKNRPFEHYVIPRHTNFTVQVEFSGIQEVYGWLTTDKNRNDLILDDLLNALEKGRSPLLLTERTEHLEELAQRLKGAAKNVIVLKGGMNEKERALLEEQIKRISDEEERVLLATGRYIGEGFDDARLDTLFLAMPISWKGTLQQYVGRLHRLHANKKTVQVYDYVDAQVPMLRRMYERRLKGYQAVGYSFSDKSPLL